MSNARNLADIVTGNFDVPLGALDNVPPSNDASALTTGTLGTARLPSGSIIKSEIIYVPQGYVGTSVDDYSNAPTVSNTNPYWLYTHTPVGNNSKFIFQFKCNVDSDGGSSGSGEFVALFQEATSALLGLSYHYRRTSGSEPVMHTIYAPYTHSGNGQFQLRLRVKSANSYNMYFNRMHTLLSSDKNSYLIVTEIAA